MNKIFLDIDFYCTLHLLKNSVPLTDQNASVKIMRNSDKLFLQSDFSFTSTEFYFDMEEITNGLYQWKLSVSTIEDMKKPNSYTIFYKVTINNIDYFQSEQLYTEYKNRSRLV